MDAKKQNNDSFITLKHGPQGDSQFFQLDIGNLHSKSLSFLVNESKREFKNVGTQTEFDETVTLKVEFERKKKYLEAEFAKQKVHQEEKFNNRYSKMLKSKDVLINDLKSEKDFLWQEMRDLREYQCQVINGSKMNASSTDALEWDLEKDSGIIRRSQRENSTKQSNKISNLSLNIQDKEILLCSIMKLHKQRIVEAFQREKQALYDKLEIEKDLIREEITSELEGSYQQEIRNLHETVIGLQEVINAMKTQKHELAKIFEGEKNALQLAITRQDEEMFKITMVTKKMPRNIIQIHKDWPVTKI